MESTPKQILLTNEIATAGRSDDNLKFKSNHSYWSIRLRECARDLDDEEGLQKLKGGALL